MKEVELLGGFTPHTNLLPLLGYCAEPGNPPCLVYPLCVGGTLEDRLMPHSSSAKMRLTALSWAATPDPLPWRARMCIMRDAARALAHLHAQTMLHGDVKPSNILLDDRGVARLADFGLARMAKRHGEATAGAAGATQSSFSAVKGTAEYLDPIYMQDGVATELTDGFAFGMTLLVALTGQAAKGLKQRCRHMIKWPDDPARWQKPGVPDEAAGSWDSAAACELATIVNGLDERWAEDRMPLADVLLTLERLVEQAGGVLAASSSSVQEQPEEQSTRMCIICEAAPREVRFACGHATVCSACLPSVVDTHRKCPTCNTPFGAQPIAEQGAHVQSAPTFVMPSPARQSGRGRGRGR